MSKFVLGVVVGTGLGAFLFAEGLAAIWRKGRWHDIAFGIDQQMAEMTGEPKQLVDLSDLPSIPSPR